MASPALVETVSSVNEFKTIEKTVRLVVVHFFADWASQCSQMDEVLFELKKKMSTVSFYRIEAEKLPEISQKCGITAVPTIIFLKNGKVVDRVDGTNASEVSRKVKQWSNSDIDVIPAPTGIKDKQDINARLKVLVNSAKCMLFMKGTPGEPKCRFSKQTIALLDGLNAEYSTFNILADNDVREGLKTYSDWPTYPQLYVDGELLGGLDILKEMAESGELAEKLPCKESLDTRLKVLVKKAPVMVFMKGHPTQPQCGFSKQLVTILDETKVDYKTFNILSDDDVRQGLKTLYNWPTFPQVYVKGELIGGLDIIKELKESGELVQQLKGE